MRIMREQRSSSICIEDREWTSIGETRSPAPQSKNTSTWSATVRVSAGPSHVGAIADAPPLPCGAETGGLFRIAIRLMEATSSQPDKGYVFSLSCCRVTSLPAHAYTTLCRAYVPLVNLIGIFFQIADDYLNLQSDAVRSCQRNSQPKGLQC